MLRQTAAPRVFRRYFRISWLGLYEFHSYVVVETSGVALGDDFVKIKTKIESNDDFLLVDCEQEQNDFRMKIYENYVL